MPYTVQAITLNIRGGEDHKKHGDKYKIVGTVQIVGKTAFISAVVKQFGEFTRDDFREISAAVLALPGINKIEYERMHNGVCSLKTVEE